MRLATPEQAARIDELSKKNYELSGDLLVEAAGALSAREIAQSFLPELSKGEIAIVCGPGNNGADGLVIARHLAAAGYRNVRVYLIAPVAKRSPLFRTQLKRVVAHGLVATDLSENSRTAAQLHSAALIIDALFGTGFNRKVESPFAEIIAIINAAPAPKISVDAPSGLHSGTGRADGPAVKAAMTLTFGLAKPGFYVAHGPGLVGRLRTIPIGHPQALVREVATSHFLFTERLARRNLPGRPDVSNKSNHGKLLVLAGREGFWGAGVLASAAAFRMGAGYVHWASFTAPNEALKSIPEVLTGKTGDEELWRTKYTAACVGPGLGTGAETAALIERLKGIAKLPVVVDADAITACVEHKLFPLPAHWVITPHAGELSRITKMEVSDIERDRFAAAAHGARVTRCFTLLKGFRSVLARGKRNLIIHSGNSALAKAGTGDVLTGMIGGLLAQGLGPRKAAATAAYLHGKMADEWVRRGQDKSSLTASDLTELLPSLIARLRNEDQP